MLTAAATAPRRSARGQSQGLEGRQGGLHNTNIQTPVFSLNYFTRPLAHIFQPVDSARSLVFLKLPSSFALLVELSHPVLFCLSLSFVSHSSPTLLKAHDSNRDVELDRRAEAAQHMYLRRCLRKKHPTITTTINMHLGSKEPCESTIDVCDNLTRTTNRVRQIEDQRLIGSER